MWYQCAHLITAHDLREYSCSLETNAKILKRYTSIRKDKCVDKILMINMSG